MGGKLICVVGGQFGSEAKGAVVAELVRKAEAEGQVVGVCRVAGPNAGHTVYTEEGRKLSYRQVPVGAAVGKGPLWIAAGSEIDSGVLVDEIGWVVGTEDRLYIDGQATVITQAEKDAEKADGSHGDTFGTHGSTHKGIGAARAARALRKAVLWKRVEAGTASLELERAAGLRVTGGWDTAEQMRAWMRKGGTVIIEGTQGYGLGSHAGYYPSCTSSDCRAVDFIAMAGLSPWDSAIDRVEVWVVYRTYPIRIAGNSGPMHKEISWAELNSQLIQRGGQPIEPELTTVTQKQRRIGMWDSKLARAAAVANGAGGTTDNVDVRAALMFTDYLDPKVGGVTDSEDRWELDEIYSEWAHNWIQQREALLGMQFELLGTGPQSIIDNRRERR